MSDSSSNSAAFEIISKIMISAVIVFFVVVTFIFLLHLYARCLWGSTPEDPEIVSWRRQLAGQNRPAGSASRRPKGLKSSALKSLPVSIYNPNEFKEGLECSICLSELQELEKVRVLPNCNHGFHLECIDKWFHTHSTCPICRAPVVPEAVEGSNSVQVEDQQEEADVNELGQSREFPTNVLFWGDETEVRTSQDPTNGGLEVVIDVAVEEEEEERSPVMNRIRSLQRMLSRGKRVSPSPCSTSS